MTGTSVRDDDWGTPTHYSSGKPIEPRMFTEADPMTTGMFPADWGGDTRSGGASPPTSASRAVATASAPARSPPHQQPTS